MVSAEVAAADWLHLHDKSVVWGEDDGARTSREGNVLCARKKSCCPKVNNKQVTVLEAHVPKPSFFARREA